MHQLCVLAGQWLLNWMISGCKCGSVILMFLLRTDWLSMGDAFCGGLASGLARGTTMAEAMRWGAAAGALAATIKGAVPSLPSLEKVTELLER